MVGVSTVVSSLLSTFRVRCFGSIASAFRKYSERRKYFEMFGIITQIQTMAGHRGLAPSDWANVCNQVKAFSTKCNVYKQIIVYCNATRSMFCL